jgi:phosphate transport system protein
MGAQTTRGRDQPEPGLGDEPMPSGAFSVSDRLAGLEARLLEALDLVGISLECSVEAIEGQDVDLARMVVCDDDYTDARYVEVTTGVVSALGSRLDEVQRRTAVALLQISRHVERVGDHCVNLAKLVRAHGRGSSTDPLLIERIGGMGRLARAQLWRAKVALAERDVALAEDMVRRDQELNRLNRESFRIAVELGAAPEWREWAMHMMLAARWLERVGDNAVDIGEAGAFIATGTARAFTRVPGRGWTDAASPG